ncbi:MAG: PilZ domain-containing protein [Desulfovibrio sp.]
MAREENKRNTERAAVQKQVEFFVDADIIRAESVDLSGSGIRMNTDRPITIRLRLYHADGGFDEHLAELVWAARKGEAMSYGFEFQPDPEGGTGA